MKKLFIAFLLLTSGVAFAAGPGDVGSVGTASRVLYKKKFKRAGDEGDSQARIVATFKAALEDKKDNEVKKIVEQIKSDFEGMGQVGEITARNLFLLENGRGGYGNYSSIYLVGLLVAHDGSGMIEDYETYFIVHYNLDMNKSTETVTIESQASIQPM